MSETATRGVIYYPDKAQGVECYVDAYFAGGWYRDNGKRAGNVLSRSGYAIFNAGCPLLWASKLHTEIALSTAEAEYIALSAALWEVILFMYLLLELSELIELHLTNPKMKCKIVEDNDSCIVMVKANHFSPRTKHIALNYHHFRTFVEEK